MIALGGGTFKPAQVRLRLPGTRDGTARGPLRTFGARFGTTLPGGLVMGCGYALAIGLERSLYDGVPLTRGTVIEGTLIDMLILGLTFGLAGGLLFGLLATLETPLDDTTAATPNTLLSTNRAVVTRQILILVPALALAIDLGGLLITDAFQGILGQLNWTLSSGLYAGAVAGFGGALGYGLCFTAWGRWILLSRLWLPLTGKLPWDLAAFLDDAYQRGVLRQTGAVYQFRHIRLQHHLGHTFRRQSPDYAPARFPTPRTEAADPATHEAPQAPPPPG